MNIARTWEQRLEPRVRAWFTNFRRCKYGNKNTAIGSKVATVDGKKVLMEQEPFIIEILAGTVSPVRFVAETRSQEVEWNDRTKEITITK